MDDDTAAAPGSSPASRTYNEPLRMPLSGPLSASQTSSSAAWKAAPLPSPSVADNDTGHVPGDKPPRGGHAQDEEILSGENAVAGSPQLVDVHFFSTPVRWAAAGSHEDVASTHPAGGDAASPARARMQKGRTDAAARNHSGDAVRDAGNLAPPSTTLDAFRAFALGDEEPGAALARQQGGSRRRAQTTAARAGGGEHSESSRARRSHASSKSSWVDASSASGFGSSVSVSGSTSHSQHGKRNTGGAEVEGEWDALFSADGFSGVDASM